MSRRLVFRLLTVTLASALTLAAIEIGLRLAPVSADRPSPVIDDGDWAGPGEPRRRLKPFDQAAKPAGTFRLVALGDSFTWGAGVDQADTWAVRLYRRLAAAAPDLRLDLVNLSLPGWNTAQELFWFRRNLDTLDPDLAVLAYCLNDAEPRAGEDLWRLRAVLGDTAGHETAGPSPRRSPSVLLDRLATSWENLRSRRRVTAYYHALYGEEPGWEEARKALRGLARLSRERGFPLLMVVFPIFDSNLDHRYPYRKLHQAARRAGEEAGLTVLDLLPFYEGVDARRLAIVPFTDPHPNELAHRIAADAIAGYLIEHELSTGKESP